MSKIFTNWGHFHTNIATEQDEIGVKIQHLRKTNTGLEWFEDHFDEFKQKALSKMHKSSIE